MASDAAIETAIPAERAAALIGDGAQAIDVRRPQEWNAGRIAGAQQIEMNELSDAAEIDPERSTGRLLLSIRKPVRPGG